MPLITSSDVSTDRQKMGKKKENIKLRDLELSKDAKGGRATYAGILREGGGPKPYYFGKTVTYMTRSGKVLDEDAVKRRIKVAVPIQVHYRGRRCEPDH